MTTLLKTPNVGMSYKLTVAYARVAFSIGDDDVGKALKRR